VRLATNHRRSAGQSLRERRNEIDRRRRFGLFRSTPTLRLEAFFLPSKQIINGCAVFYQLTQRFTIRSGRNWVVGQFDCGRVSGWKTVWAGRIFGHGHFGKMG
jgi:hypothetical protein